MNCKITKFSWTEATSNTKTGKTSGSGTAGLIVIGVGCLAFLGGVTLYFLEKEGGDNIILHSLGLITVGSGLLGVRKHKDGIEKSNTEENKENIQKLHS